VRCENPFQRIGTAHGGPESLYVISSTANTKGHHPQGFYRQDRRTAHCFNSEAGDCLWHQACGRRIARARAVDPSRTAGSSTTVVESAGGEKNARADAQRRFNVGAGQGRRRNAICEAIDRRDERSFAYRCITEGISVLRHWLGSRRALTKGRSDPWVSGPPECPHGSHS